MNLLPTPKIKSCLFCGTFNLIMVNGVNYENNFQSLKDWTLKKKFNCRKCNVEMGFFVNNSKQERTSQINATVLGCYDDLDVIHQQTL